MKQVLDKLSLNDTHPLELLDHDGLQPAGVQYPLSSSNILTHALCSGSQVVFISALYCLSQMGANALSIVWQLAGGQKQNLITWIFRAMVEHWPQEVKGSNPFFSAFSNLINRNHIPQGSKYVL